MNKLWVYGCSFSDDYMSDSIEKAWFNIIAENFNLGLETAKRGEYLLLATGYPVIVGTVQATGIRKRVVPIPWTGYDKIKMEK